jgi:preprotein translocase subunit Sec61beta
MLFPSGRMVDIHMIQPFAGLLSSFSLQDLSAISPYVVIAIAGLFSIIGAIATLIFEYHWKTYLFNKAEVLRMRFWYYIGTVVFGGGMLIFAFLFLLIYK